MIKIENIITGEIIECNTINWRLGLNAIKLMAYRAYSKGFDGEITQLNEDITRIKATSFINSLGYYGVYVKYPIIATIENGVIENK